jgi:hypothetical protein
MEYRWRATGKLTGIVALILTFIIIYVFVSGTYPVPNVTTIFIIVLFLAFLTFSSISTFKSVSRHINSISRKTEAKERVQRLNEKFEKDKKRIKSYLESLGLRFSVEERTRFQMSTIKWKIKNERVQIIFRHPASWQWLSDFIEIRGISFPIPL